MKRFSRNFKLAKIAKDTKQYQLTSKLIRQNQLIRNHH